MGKLVPIGLTEVLPGDTVQQATSALVRCSPLLAPVMHPVEVRIHHWFVPHRIVWDDWENFITGGPDGLNASVFPTITVNTGTGFANGSLADYLGIPPLVDDKPVSALPFRGYAAIFNEWYRDQDLVTALTIDRTDGADTTTNTTLQNIAWEKDYFTSSRPTTQKGPDVELPLGSVAITRVSNALGWHAYNTGANTDASGTIDATAGRVGDSNSEISFDPEGGLVGTVGSTTVNELRYAMALQRYEEARSRYGSRYTEYLRYLGIRSSDARLQRPEYLGGGKQTIQFSEVLQTGPTTSGSALGVGDMKGHGIAALRSNRYRRFFEEHGYVFSLMSVRPKTIYATGLPRTWSRTTKEDFFQKELQHVGQQEVYKKEAYWADTSGTTILGYQDRYDDYRRAESSIAGEFRTTLSYWHMARLFTSDIALNSTFVTCVPTDRIYAVTSTHELYVMANHSIQARRIVAQTGNSFIY